MPALKTELTEIITGLGMLGFSTVEEALAARPIEMIGVEDMHWDRLSTALRGGDYALEYTRAWSNGVAFLQAREGLRNRMPLRIEWKGQHQTPGYDLIPADLRIDHVYLVSCKYLSRILFNASPLHLFERLLTGRNMTGAEDWYALVAPDAYQAFYSKVREYFARSLTLPARIQNLAAAERNDLTAMLRGAWPGELLAVYRGFCQVVSMNSAAHWRARLASPQANEEMLWRLLRLASAPYFVLGASPAESLRLRVYTPWDWRKEFVLRAFDVTGDSGAGQPTVRWRALVQRKYDGAELQVDGHVEVRWSHGRFCGNPEAKVYLDIPHVDVPGYVQLR